MIKLLEVKEFQDIADCRSLLYQSRESFLKCSFKLTCGNIYGVISDFGCGSWGLVTCLAGRGTENYSGVIFIDDKQVPFTKLSSYSCFITETNFFGADTAYNKLTTRQCIEKALAIGRQPYSVSEIKEIFRLSDGRFDRPVTEASGEIWLISAAVNFSLGKDIFCYPWLNEIDIVRFKTACELGILDFLKSSGKIILVPSSQEKVLRKLCDRTMKFHNGEFLFK